MKPVTLPGVEEYAAAHTTHDSQCLIEIAERTHAHLTDPQMMSGHVQGRFLELLVHAIRPNKVLEVGTFSGYACITMATALPQNGHIDTCEINPVHAAMAREHIASAGVVHQVTLHEGPALATLDRLSGPYDLVWMDADKGSYEAYLEAVLPKLSPRGVILADNTLWNGDVLNENTTDEDSKALQAFNDRVAADPRLRVTLLTIRDGVTMIAPSRTTGWPSGMSPDQSAANETAPFSPRSDDRNADTTADIRGAKHIPLAVMPHPSVRFQTLALPTDSLSQIGDAEQALRALAAQANRADRRRGLDPHLDEAQRTMAVLIAHATSRYSVIEGRDLPESVLVHRYFGVRRERAGTPSSIVHALIIIHRALCDLGFAAVDGHDIAAEATAMVEMLTEFRPQADVFPDDRTLQEDGPVIAARAEPLIAYRPDGSALDRWMVGHHLYFLLNLFCAELVDRATSQVRLQQWPVVSTVLDRITGVLQGITGSMAHSAAMSYDEYNIQVRPTMAPPMTPVGLTGSMQPEHRALRARLADLLSAFAETEPQTQRGCAEQALGRLLGADLSDLERHVLVADSLVGSRPSLAARTPDDSAVTALREMRDRRQAHYSRFLEDLGMPNRKVG